MPLPNACSSDGVAVNKLALPRTAGEHRCFTKSQGLGSLWLGMGWNPVQKYVKLYTRF